MFEGDTEPGDSPLLGSLRRDLVTNGVGGTLSLVPARVLERAPGRVTSVGVGPTLTRFAGDGGPPARILAGDARVDIGGGWGFADLAGLPARAEAAGVGVALTTLAGLSAREGAVEEDGVARTEVTVDVRGLAEVLEVRATLIGLVDGVAGGGWAQVSSSAHSAERQGSRVEALRQPLPGSAERTCHEERRI